MRNKQLWLVWGVGVLMGAAMACVMVVQYATVYAIENDGLRTAMPLVLVIFAMPWPLIGMIRFAIRRGWIPDPAKISYEASHSQTPGGES